MAKFMIILHETPGAMQSVAPEELPQIVGRYSAWMDKLRATDRWVTSEKLRWEGGKILSARGGRLSVVDGPYIEAKEVVGGYFTIRAANYDEAVQLVSDCPHLEFGRIEVRQTDPMGCGGE